MSFITNTLLVLSFLKHLTQFSLLTSNNLKVSTCPILLSSTHFSFDINKKKSEQHIFSFLCKEVDLILCNKIHR